MKSKFNWFTEFIFHLGAFPKIRAKPVLFLLTFLCLSSMGYHYLRQDNVVSLTEAAGYVVVPLQKGINSIGSFFFSIGQERMKLQEALEANEQLELELAAVKDENAQMQADMFELRRLQELFSLSQEYSEYETVGANVIGESTGGNWYPTFTIDKGTNDGLAVDMNVLADGGLAGIITDIGPHHATVTSIINDNMNVRAMQQSTSEPCFVMGDLTLMEEGRIRLQYMDKEFDITKDNVIVTSNVSDKFLPGIVIGYAEDVTINDNKLTKTGYLRPAVDFQHLNEVLVITTLKQIEGQEGTQ